MTDRDEEIRRNQEKWKKWNEERKKQDLKKNLKAEENLQNYVLNITQKLGDPGEKKKDKQIVNKIGTQVETNSCPICLQLMVPPQIPIIIFPCGHNVCKMCLFENAEIKKQKYKLKVQKCPICRNKINNHAQNRNLMALICTYTDNKHLLEKQLAEENEEQEKDNEDIYQLRVRCEVLQGEKNVLQKQLAYQKKQKGVIDQVVEQLLSEKKRNMREMEQLEEEKRLIEKHLDEKYEFVEGLKKKIQYTEEKKRIIEKTLEPLKIQKQKLELLEAARLIEKN